MGYAKTNADTVRAKKSLGQHFLTDLNIARRIAGALSGGGSALEIGGGMGVLTQFLLERDDITLWGIEIDRESIAYMREHFPTFATGGQDGADGTDGTSDTGRLIEGDFLKFDLRGQFPHGVKIVGNFPYNISSQIFFKVLENRDLVPEFVGMIQREVAQRIAEPPGSRTYGIMSVLLQAWYDIEYLFTVSEGVFSPPPKVKSAVIRLTRNSVQELGCDEELFVRVVKAAFGQRRKMLRNSLRAVFGDFGGAEHPFFTDRAEKLSVPQFVELTNWVSERIS
jgi:16S rRNA (adenine1518-N6/adenine1519-N6)-dimethyltransferase